MAEDNQKKDTSAMQMANNVAKAAGSVKNAVQAAAKAGAGDIAGAVIDVLKDENLRKIIICTILLVAFLFAAGSMLISSAISGVVENIVKGFTEAWDENYEEEAVKSGGNLVYLYSTGELSAAAGTAWDVISDLLTLPEKTINLEPAPDGKTDVDTEDYDKTLQSINDEAALTGEDGALRKRLDMIKGRVEERGLQLKTYADTQYTMEALGIAIAESLANTFNNPFLYNGVDIANCSVEFDHSAFQMSDLQAIKILAAYSIQKDCSLAQIEMWDLMDYCGWYDENIVGYLDQAFMADSIYNSSINGVFDREIGGVVSAGEIMDSTTYNLQAPFVPYWIGTCAPQWYYEEIAQLLKSNDKNNGVSGALIYKTDNDGNILKNNFEKLSAYHPFGLIDKLYTSTNASLTVSRTEYHGADEYLDEALSKYTGEILQAWKDAYAPKEEYTPSGSYLHQSADGAITYSFSNTIGGRQYYLVNNSTGYVSEAKRASSTGATITFYDLRPDNSYVLYVTWRQRIPGVHGSQITPEDGDKSELMYETKTEVADSFTTFEDIATTQQAYQLQLHLNISYAARSVDDLTLELLGLWPGSLEDTQEGGFYAHGHEGNPNLVRYWSDTYTDENGNTHTVALERQQGYQCEAYQDIVLAIADMLGVDTTGLYAPNYGYGDSIVSVAEKELAYYQANNLYGGMRYWNLAKDAIGWNFGSDAGWCACFILCCANECGYIGPGQPFGDLGTNWHFWCGGLYDDLITAGATGYKTASSNYQPVPGDIIFFDPLIGGNGDYQHVGIVAEVLEDGKIVTIEGNSGKRVKKNTYSNYAIGTPCYRNNGRMVVISAYVHPNYPAAYLENPLYISVGGMTAASADAREVSSILLTGYPRFRISQLPDVVAELKKSYPALYQDSVGTAVEAKDTAAFITAWNNMGSYGKAEQFKAAQQSIFSRLYVRPIVTNVMAATGFDWTATTVREELLLSIVSTTDNHNAATSLLQYLCADMDNSASDETLIASLQTDYQLATALQANKDTLWPHEPEEIQNSWINGILTVMYALASQTA